jgi:pseudouridylate synthase
MICARLAGIPSLPRAGIGGVHRGAETSFDISADLQELAQTPVTVVAAGAKAILDLPKTLEVLETLGVPVIAYGQDAAGLLVARSGLRAPLRADTAAKLPLRTGCAGGWVCRGGNWWPIPFPPMPRFRWPRSDR